MNKLPDKGAARRREPITDTQLLLTITICIFIVMYVAAMLIWGGGFKKPQMLLDALKEQAGITEEVRMLVTREGLLGEDENGVLTPLEKL